MRYVTSRIKNDNESVVANNMQNNIAVAEQLRTVRKSRELRRHADQSKLSTKKPKQKQVKRSKKAHLAQSKL